MLIIPIRATGPERGPLVLVLILERENMKRMRLADPFDVKLSTLREAGVNTGIPLRDIDLVIAYEEDRPMIEKLQREHDLPGLVRWLERGRRIKPGDMEPLTRLGERRKQ